MNILGILTQPSAPAAVVFTADYLVVAGGGGGGSAKSDAEAKAREELQGQIEGQKFVLEQLEKEYKDTMKRIREEFKKSGDSDIADKWGGSLNTTPDALEDLRPVQGHVLQDAGNAGDVTKQ